MKKIIGTIKLQILPGKANPAPPVGPALGQRGVNIGEFIKRFNNQSKNLDPSMPVAVNINVFEDKTFDIIIKKPSVSSLLKKAASCNKGSSAPGKEVSVGTVTKEDILNIANIKIVETNAFTIEKAVKSIEGSARSIGLDIKR